MPFADHPGGASAAARDECRPACPVCGRPAGLDYSCAECHWPLRSPRRVGPVTDQLRADFERQLDGACRLFDARAAALAGPDPGSMAGWIRGGKPSPKEWLAARAAASTAAAGALAEAAAIPLLTSALRPLAAGAGITIVEVGPVGIAVARASADRVGAVALDAEVPVARWPDLVPVLAAEEGERRFQLAGGIAALDRDLLDACLASITQLMPAPAAGGEALVLRQPGWRLVEDAAGRMLAGRAGARLVRVTGLPSRGNGLLESLADRVPLLRGYGVVVAAIAPSTGAVTLETRPLFGPGTARGTESVLRLRRVPGDQGSAALAVAIDSGPAPLAGAVNGASLGLLSLHSVPLPDQPVYEVRAVLDAPGQVRFTAPRGITALSRPWPDVLAGLPDRVDVHDGPVDLICALELAGPKGAVDRRRDLIGDLLRHLAAEYPGDAGRLRVGLLGCTDHVFAWPQEGRRVVRVKQPGPLSDALPALANFEGADIGYAPAAPLEDMLHVAEETLAVSRAEGRAGRLLLVASRRAHPRGQGPDLVHPCPFKCDWRVTARNLSQARVPVLAVLDAMPGRAARADFWGKVAPAGLRPLNDTSAVDLAADLGLTVRRGQRIGIPLAG